MLKISDIIMEPNDDEDYIYNNGYINIPVVVFGQLRFTTANQRLGLTLPKGAKTEDLLGGLNRYLDWLSGCKNELIAFYKKEFKEDLLTYCEGKMPEDWFETLEVYSGNVSYGVNGTFGADFSTGDTIDHDHLLMIEIEDKKIMSMWHDG